MLPNQVDEEKLIKAVELVKEQAVKHLIHASKEIIIGEVEDNYIIYHVSFNRKNLEEASCTCECGKKGIICEHILALFLTQEIDEENFMMLQDRRQEYDSLAYVHNYDNKMDFIPSNGDEEYDDFYQLYYSEQYITRILANMTKEEIIKLVLNQIDFNKIPYIHNRLKQLKAELLDGDAGENVTAIIEQFNFRVHMAAEELYLDVIGAYTLGLSQKEKDHLSWVILHGEDSQIEDLLDIFINKGVYGHPVLTDAFRILYPVLSSEQKELMEEYIDENIKNVNVSRINISTARGNLLIMKHIISEYQGNTQLDDDVKVLIKYSSAIPFVNYIFDYYALQIDELIEKINDELKNFNTNIRNLEYLYQKILEYKSSTELMKEIYYIDVLNCGDSASLRQLISYQDFDVYLKRLQNSDICPSQLMSVYCALGMNKELFDLIKETRCIKDLVTYTPKLKDTYNEELVALYFELFDKKAKKAKRASEVKQTCRMLKGLLKCNNGKAYCQELYDIMKEKYPQKSGLHNEIAKYLNK